MQKVRSQTNQDTVLGELAELFHEHMSVLALQIAFHNDGS